MYRRFRSGCAAILAMTIVAFSAEGAVVGTQWLIEQGGADGKGDSGAHFLGDVYIEGKGIERSTCLANDAGKFDTAGLGGSLSLSTSIDQRRVASSVGLDAGLDATFGLTNVTASVQFADNSVETSNAIAATFLIDLSPGIVVQASHPAVAAGKALEDPTCGRMFVSGVRYGAKLIVSIRVLFKSVEAKRQAQASGGISGPWGSLGNL